MNIKKLIIAVCLTASSVGVMAANSSITGTVKYVIARSTDGLTYFSIDGVRHGDMPDCASVKNSYWMIKDEDSEAGKRQFAMILAAYASGAKVTVVGTGECFRWPNGEDVAYIQLKK